MTRYRKKPVEVEAWQVGTEPMPKWLEELSLGMGYGGLVAKAKGSIVPCSTYEGDWLVYGDGEGVRSVPSIVFDQTYEVVE